MGGRFQKYARDDKCYGKWGQAGRGDREGGLAPCNRHLQGEAWVPSTQPQLDGTCASLALRDSSIPGVATATPYTNPSYRVLAGHTLPPESGEQFKGTRPGTHPSVPSTGGLSPAWVTSLYLFTLLLPSSCTPASLRKSHASPHRKRAALSPALEGLWSFHWRTVVDIHIPGSSPVRLRPPR